MAIHGGPSSFFCAKCGWQGINTTVFGGDGHCPDCGNVVYKQAPVKQPKPDPYANYPAVLPEWMVHKQQEALDKIRFRECGPLDMQAIFGKQFTVLQRTYHATTDVYVVILKNVETGNTLHVFMYELDDEWHVSHVDRLIRNKDSI